MRPWEFKSPHGHQFSLAECSRDMKWLDIEDIAEALEEKFPDEDIVNIRFTELKKKVLGLEGFDDDEKRCNEKILEAIQVAWIGERS